MVKRQRTTTQTIIDKRLKEGQEKNTNADYDYKPWLTIQDVPSRGRTACISGMTAKSYTTHCHYKI